MTMWATTLNRPGLAAAGAAAGLASTAGAVVAGGTPASAVTRGSVIFLPACFFHRGAWVPGDGWGSGRGEAEEHARARMCAWEVRGRRSKEGVGGEESAAAFLPLSPLSTCSIERRSPLSRTSHALPPFTMINWRRLDAWRAHPLLSHTMRASAPGLALGAAAFAAYVAWDKAAGGGGGAHH